MQRLLRQRLWGQLLWVLAWVLVGPQTFAAEPDKPLVVFAAASLTDALQKITDEYTKSSAVQVKLSFAASSSLAKQIENGAPVDVFFSADREWMDYLDGKGLINAGSRTDLLGNRLALIAPADSKVSLQLAPNAAIAAALGDNGRLATGDPDSVPVGKYAKAALTSFGLWKELEPRLARAENVRVALSYVARGEAPLGIVYATDAAVEPRVRVIGLFPESSHGPITYPLAMTRSAQARTADYLQFLRGATAKGIFTKAGFTTLGAGSAMINGCSGFAFDVSRELALFAGSAADVTAGTSTPKAAMLEPGKLYRVMLNPQQATRFAVQPGKRTAPEGLHAGILQLAPSAAATLRVSLSEAAWIDVVSDGNVLESSRHTGSHDCALLRKSVEFAVKPGTPVSIQLSGSSEQSVKIVVSTS